MLKYKKIIFPLVVIVIISWIFNLIFYKSNSIQEPIFTYIYYEGSGDSKIKYIIDENSNDKVTSVSFPELNDFQFAVDQNNNSVFGQNDIHKRRNDDNMARYKVYDIDMCTLINEYNRNIQSYKNEFEITKIKYRTESGKEGACDIGKIHYINHEENKTKYKLIEKISDKSSEDCNEICSRTLDDINMVSINSEIKDMLFDYYEIKVNNCIINEDSFPIKFKRDEEVKISIKKKKDIPFYINLCGNVHFTFEDPEGSCDDIKVSIPQHNNYNNFTYSDMNKLLNKRGLK